MAIALAALLFIAKDAVVTLYSGHAAVVAVGAPLVAWVALYHLVDAVQCFCIFALRCYRIMIAPLVVYSLLLWGAGLGVACWPTTAGGPGPPSPRPPWLWITTSAAALAVTALAFVAMSRRCLLPGTGGWRG